MSLPTAVEKRDILFGAVKVSTDKLKALGREFAAAGWHSDALDFYGQAGEKAAVLEIREKAVEDGDTFLLLKTGRILGDSESIHGYLERCAARAESLGKTRYAMRAWEKLEKHDQVKRLRDTVLTDGDIKAEDEAAAAVFIPENQNDLDDEGLVSTQRTGG